MIRRSIGCTARGLLALAFTLASCHGSGTPSGGAAPSAEGAPVRLSADAKIGLTTPSRGAGLPGVDVPPVPVSQRRLPIPAGLVPASWSAVDYNPASRIVRVSWQPSYCTLRTRKAVFFVVEQARRVTIDLWLDDVQLDLGKEIGCVARADSPIVSEVRLREPPASRELLSHFVIPSPSPTPEAAR